MGLAVAVRKRANCLGSRVGAVVVKEWRVLSTGYNGTPSKMPNCLEGGCERCAHPEKFESGKGYDLCICVHAEQNCLLAAARFGISVEGATIYTTMRPCFGCTKELLQAGVERVVYIHDWQHPDPAMQNEYSRIQSRFPGGINKLDMEDPDQVWALPAKKVAE
ncbi:MAG: CMP deaminase [Gemmatimonadetes bacterium]|nr:CMP deaminase [Gemmatimonadota bacterium]NIO32881.1 CMP deaminase [Gemmatimonadota bacterium]